MSINLGQIKSIFRQSTSPVRTDVLWYDTINKVLKYFQSDILTWLPLYQSQLIGTLTNDTPTKSEITAVIGLLPTQVNIGFRFTIKNTGDNKLYYIESNGTDWFYRKSVGIGHITYSDFVMPSAGGVLLMYQELHTYGLGGFNTLRPYWSSTEATSIPNTHAHAQQFSNGSLLYLYLKSNLGCVRACRIFISSSIYSLRDIGPAGGWIFYILDNGDGTYTYHECASIDQSIGCAWSNIIDSAAGADEINTGGAIANTAAIIAQYGHITSGAKLCDDLTVTI